MRGWVWGGYHLDIGTHRSTCAGPQRARHLLGPLRNANTATLARRFFWTVTALLSSMSITSPTRPMSGSCPTQRWHPRLRRAGLVCVLVTNQSAIGRGMFTEDRLHEIHVEMNRQLAEQGAALDAIYYCPMRLQVMTAPWSRTRGENPAPACCCRRRPILIWTLAFLDGRRSDQRCSRRVSMPAAEAFWLPRA